METKTGKLSKTQIMFLMNLQRGASVSPAGQRAAAWHKTATSLEERGLVTISRMAGTQYKAELPTNSSLRAVSL